MSNPADPIATKQKLSTSELDYKFDWSKWLATGDTVQSYVVTITGSDSALVNFLSVLETSNSVRVWLRDGTVGVTYTIACKITTSAATPRIDTRRFTLTVR